MRENSVIDQADPRAQGVRVLKLVVAYDGTDFKGWQRLPGKARTVQGFLEAALGRVLGEEIEASGAGRTDAGVHAEGQVASVPTRSGKSLERILRSLDGDLPPDLAVLSAEDAEPRFHARYRATGKLYRYRLAVGARPDPFAARYALRLTSALDRGAMGSVAAALVGRRDFSAFTNAKGDKSATRELRAVRIVERGDFLDLEFEGDGFLRNQARIMAGALVEAGLGKLDVAGVAALLKEGVRAKAPGALEAKGLCLVKVLY
ncbi:MAG: tRNA pseudouridine(38-40) synthase TruA [Spirochaetales bacterium]|nr:tRNA pseudouridine(38-40) synthase TruA [Spirochaetales bacterium]